MILLAGCSADRPLVEEPKVIAESTPPPPPPLPPDIENCPREPFTLSADQIRALPEGEVAIIVEGEQGKIRLMRACLLRLICSTKEYRAKISKVAGERLCQLPGKKR